MFITDADRVWIGTDGEIEETALTPEMDAIAIYPAMSYEIQQRVIGTAVKMTQRRSDTAPRGKAKKGETDTTYDLTAYSLALLELNVLDWRGPSFTLPDGTKRPCVAANVRVLNPQMPLVVKVLDEIAVRNPNKEIADDDPNA
jgi:hypothetical protein